MSTFAELLHKDGYRERFRRVDVPFKVRQEDDEDEDDEREDSGDGLDLEGLAVPFNKVTRIRNFFEEFDEQFLPGSTKRTIGQGHQVMMFEHGDHPVLGSVPIAEIRTLEEVTKPTAGLRVQARLFDNWMTEPVRDAISAGAINGMSIMFRSVSEKIDHREDEDEAPLVSVEEADIRELGPVVFPAYGETSVTLRKEFNESVRRSVEAALSAADVNPNGGVNNSEPVGPDRFHPTPRKHLALARARLTIMELT